MKPGHIAVILSAPENVDNIGAVARALKNMGFSDLRLVRPPSGWKVRGKKMAMSAVDTLKQSRVFHSLPEAIRDLHLVFGTTRRRRGPSGFFVPFHKTITMLRRNSLHKRIGIVFGCESKGLANKDILLCDHLVTIPASEGYPSLNLAQAVMVILFALSSGQDLSKEKTLKPQARFLTKKEIVVAVAHFEQALKSLGYRKGGANLLPRILQTFQGLLKRSGLLEPEAQMIKGLSRRIKDKILNCKASRLK